jgi:Cu+-exporting ATPase
MTKDPVCGMEIDESRAKTSTIAGHTYYFCCDACKKKFDREPAKFTASEHAHH